MIVWTHFYIIFEWLIIRTKVTYYVIASVSVCLQFPFRSVTQRFRRNLTQMFTTLRRRAEVLFRMSGFKVKVIRRGQMPYDFFPFRSVTLEPLEGFRRNLTNVYQTETMCRSNVLDGWIQGHGLAIYSKSSFTFGPCIEVFWIFWKACPWETHDPQIAL